MSRARTMVAAALCLPMAFLAATVEHGAADSGTFPDPDGPRGAHDVVSVAVDNSGPVVEVDVAHRGSGWDGVVRIALDVDADGRADVVGTVRHRVPAQFSQSPLPVYQRADGSPWPCSTRSLRSPGTLSMTVLRVARSCLGGAAHVQAKVRVSRSGATSDLARSRQVAQQSRPNILMLMVDDMRTDDIAYLPQTAQLIGGAGVTFNDAFSQYPLCCPARASVLTGLYAHNHGVYSHLAPYGFHSFKDASTLPVWLHDAGYATAYLGKYLNGYGPTPPNGQTSGTSTQYVPPGWDDWRASIDGGLAADDPNDGGTYRFFDTTLNANGDGYAAYPGQYQTLVYRRLAVANMTRLAASSAPFFSYVSFSAPHHGQPVEPDDPGRVTRDDGMTYRVPTTARPAYVRGRFDDVITQAPGASWLDRDLSDKPLDIRANPPMNDAERAGVLAATRQRAEALSVVDDAVGSIVAALNATGELEETLIVFMSDNGYFLGEQNIRQGKVLPYEPSLRIPLMMRGPGIPAGPVRHDPISTIDIAPTLADMADVTPPGQIDGQSMLPVARTGDVGWTRPLLTETGPASTVRTTDESGAPLPTNDPGAPDQRYLLGIRTGRYLYTDRATGERELYDLREDPNEYVNLVADPDHAQIVGELAQQLQDVRACDGAGCRTSLPPDLVTGP